MKYIFLYETKNQVNGKTYIGVHATDDLNDNYLGSGVRLLASIKHYGKHNFIKTPLKFFASMEEAYAYEADIVNEDWISSNDNYNLALGGNGGKLHMGKRTDDWKKEQSQRMVEYYKIHSPTNLGRKFSKDWKNNISRIRLEKELSKGENNPNFGKTHSTETRKKMSDGCKTQKKFQCPHCGIITIPGNIKRWHMDNCKKKS